MKRKIAVATGSRAEYGLLRCLLKEIAQDPDLHLQLIVTGSHLDKNHGLTLSAIHADGFSVQAKVFMDLSDNSSMGVTRALGQAVQGFGEVLARLKPDLLVVLGDRYETLAAAQAALVAAVPLAHIHGGESTEGLIDEAIRHAVTKMSHLHFVAAKPYRNRVIQLGENPSKVYCVGAPGLDNIEDTPFLSLAELEQSLKIQMHRPIFLVTYHPVTLEPDAVNQRITELLKALDRFSHATILFTGANADVGGKMVNDRLAAYASKHAKRTIFSHSLGASRYLSAMRLCDVVIGNSSSGILEAPVFKKPTVNIGDRQKGRLKAKSVLDCKEDGAAIAKSISRALSKSFQKSLACTLSLYGRGGNISRQIKERLKRADLNGILNKRFYSIGGEKRR